MLTCNVLYSTAILQHSDSSIDILLQCELRHALNIYCTMLHPCQIRTISMLRTVGQHAINYIQWAFPAYNGYSQFIHAFQPSSLLLSQINLHPNIHPQFMVSINHHRYTINITMQFYTYLVYCQKSFLLPP